MMLIVFVILLVGLYFSIQYFADAQKLAYKIAAQTNTGELQDMRKLVKYCSPIEGWGADVFRSSSNSDKPQCDKKCQTRLAKQPFASIPGKLKALQFDKSSLCDPDCPKIKACISLVDEFNSDGNIKVEAAREHAEACAYVCNWIHEKVTVCGTVGSEIWTSGAGTFNTPCLDRSRPLP